jgi:hypothetical protein
MACMKAGRASIYFFSACAVFVVIALLLWLSVLQQFRYAKAAQQQFDVARERFVDFLEKAGYPSLAFLKSEEAAVLELSQLEVSLRQSLLMPTQEGVFKKESSRPADLIFNLQSLVDKLGREAQERNVILKNRSSHFGFGATLRDAMPSSAQELERLGKQCQLMEVLGQYLLVSSPDQILKIEREGTLSTDVKRSEEIFFPQDAYVQRLKQHFSVLCFRFSFLGKTESLRTFLNQVSASPWPFFIAEVGVSSTEPPAGGSAQRPVVGGGATNFYVTVAWVGEVS